MPVIHMHPPNRGYANRAPAVRIATRAVAAEFHGKFIPQRPIYFAYFYDCYTVELPPVERSPLELYLSVISRTPRWIDFLMNVRNKIVAQFGLKDMGALSHIERSKPALAYRIGDQAGIFKLLELHEHEVILGETDKHLDVKISVARQNKPGSTSELRLCAPASLYGQGLSFDSAG